jgi:type I restriction enzyme M protein
MAAEQKQKLEQQLWNIANTLRGKMDADDFRDYILGFIFYKYLSTKMDLYEHHTKTRRFDLSRSHRTC